MFEYEWSTLDEDPGPFDRLQWPSWLHAAAEKVEMVPAKGNPKKLVRRIPEGAFFRDDAALDVWPRIRFEKGEPYCIRWWLRTAKGDIEVWSGDILVWCADGSIYIKRKPERT